MAIHGRAVLVLSALLLLPVMAPGCGKDKDEVPDAGTVEPDASTAESDAGTHEPDAGPCVPTTRWLMPDPGPVVDGGAVITPPLSCQELVACRAQCDLLGCHAFCQGAATPTARTLSRVLSDCRASTCDGGDCPECSEQAKACEDNEAFKTLPDGQTVPDVPSISTGCIPAAVVGKWTTIQYSPLVGTHELTINAEGRFESYSSSSSLNYRSSSSGKGWIEELQDGGLRFNDTIHAASSTSFFPGGGRPPQESTSIDPAPPRETTWKRTDSELGIRLEILNNTYVPKL